MTVSLAFRRLLVLKPKVGYSLIFGLYSLVSLYIGLEPVSLLIRLLKFYPQREVSTYLSGVMLFSVVRVLIFHLLLLSRRVVRFIWLAVILGLQLLLALRLLPLEIPMCRL